MATRCGSDLFPLPWQHRDWNRFLGVQGFWLTHRAAALKAFYGKFPRLQVSSTVPLNPLPWVQSLTLWPRFASFPKVAAFCLNVCFTHCSFYDSALKLRPLVPTCCRGNIKNPSIIPSPPLRNITAGCSDLRKFNWNLTFALLENCRDEKSGSVCQCVISGRCWKNESKNVMFVMYFVNQH